MTFYEFVIARPYTDNPAGDLADDIRADRTFPRGVATKQELVSHLTQRSASTAALTAANELWREFVRKSA
jgi:uncharacterized protein YozE (UPF0346 family)